MSSDCSVGNSFLLYLTSLSFGLKVLNFGSIPGWFYFASHTIDADWEVVVFMSKLNQFEFSIYKNDVYLMVSVEIL